MFRLDQKGVSLPIVLGLMAVIIANTIYFMDIDKSTLDQNQKRTSQIEDNSEKIRLGTFLSDSSVCNENFKNRTLANINSTPSLPATKPLTKNNINFLESSLTIAYSRGSLRLDSYEIKLDPLNPPSPPEKRNSLFITYSILNRGSGVPTGKKKLIRIPLNISFDATLSVATCYADPDKDLNTISNVIASSCLGATASLDATTMPECQHLLTLPSACANGSVLKGVDAVTSGTTPKIGTQFYTCGAVTGAGAGPTPVPCSDTPIRTLVTGIAANNTISCGTTDPGCSAGKVLVMSGSGAPVCGTLCASGYLLQTLSSAGVPTCVQRPYPCGVGKYAKQIKNNGDSVCADYTVVSKDCGAGNYAADVDPTTSTMPQTLGCRAYSKIKNTCDGVAYRYVQSFSTGTIPTCVTYTN